MWIDDLEKAAKSARALANRGDRASRRKAVVSIAKALAAIDKGDRPLLWKQEAELVRILLEVGTDDALAQCRAFVPCNGRQTEALIRAARALPSSDEGADVLATYLTRGLAIYVKPGKPGARDETNDQIAAELVDAALLGLPRSSMIAMQARVGGALEGSPSRHVRNAYARALATVKTGTQTHARKPAPKVEIPSYALDRYAREVAGEAVRRLGGMKKRTTRFNQVGLFVQPKGYRVASVFFASKASETTLPLPSPKTRIPASSEEGDYDRHLKAFFRGHGLDQEGAPTWRSEASLPALLLYRELLIEMQHRILPAARRASVPLTKSAKGVVAIDSDSVFSSVPALEGAIRRELAYFTDKSVLRSFARLCFESPTKQRALVALSML